MLKFNEMTGFLNCRLSSKCTLYNALHRVLLRKSLLEGVRKCGSLSSDNKKVFKNLKMHPQRFRRSSPNLFTCSRCLNSCFRGSKGRAHGPSSSPRPRGSPGTGPRGRTPRARFPGGAGGPRLAGRQSASSLALERPPGRENLSFREKLAARPRRV